MTRSELVGRRARRHPSRIAASARLTIRGRHRRDTRPTTTIAVRDRTAWLGSRTSRSQHHHLRTTLVWVPGCCGRWQQREPCHRRPSRFRMAAILDALRNQR